MTHPTVITRSLEDWDRVSSTVIYLFCYLYNKIVDDNFLIFEQITRDIIHHQFNCLHLRRRPVAIYLVYENTGRQRREAGFKVQGLIGDSDKPIRK